MLNIEQAEQKLLYERPDVERVEAVIRYRNAYLFRVVYRDSDEANYDPFFSVSFAGGEVNEFSFLHDGDPYEITALFLAAE